MSGKVLYDWNEQRRLDDWKLEGHGELLKDDDGALHVRTFNLGPLKRATNAWLRDLVLPERYQVSWTYRNGCETGHPIVREGVMIVFDALPVGLNDLFEDTRPEARYSAFHSYGKLVCYTCGYYRGPYGGTSQLRKLGGHVPETWKEATPPVDGVDFDKLTILSAEMEPLTEEHRAKDVRYRLEKEGASIKFWCNDELVHDISDDNLYRFYPDPIVGGKMALRTFSGYIDNYYSDLVVKEL